MQEEGYSGFLKYAMGVASIFFYFDHKFTCKNSIFKFLFEAQPTVHLECFQFYLGFALCFFRHVSYKKRSALKFLVVFQEKGSKSYSLFSITD